MSIAKGKVVLAAPPPLVASIDATADARAREIPVSRRPRRRGGDFPIDLQANRRPVARRSGIAPRAPTAAEETDVERAATAEVTCHFGVQMPQSCPLSQPAELTVTVSREELQRQLGPTSVVSKAVAHLEEPIRLEVVGKANCDVVGDAAVEVRVPEIGAPENYDFKIKGRSAGPAEIWVDARQGPRRLARMVLQPVFVADGAFVAARANVATDRPEKALVELRIIEERFDNSGYRLRFILQSEELAIGTINVPHDVGRNKDEIIKDFYDKMEGDWGQNAQEYDVFIDQVRNFGADLYEQLLPERVREELWSKREAIGCIQVFSEEPSVPWELLYLVEPGRGVEPSGCFLSELGLVRWVDNIHWPPSCLEVGEGRAFHVVPDYADPALRLAGAQIERKIVEARFKAQAVETSRAAVLGRLYAGSQIDLLHFACHGSAENDRICNAGLLMAGNRRLDGSYFRESLTISDIKAKARLSRDTAAMPIVFVNACQAGRTGRTLTGTSGLADIFLTRGAGLFVSTLWSIGDDVAHTFAERFYDGLLDGETVTQATRAAREQAKNADEPTWLAYTVYGHPYARLKMQ